MTTTPKKRPRFDPQELIDEQVAQIDEALEEIERRMRPYAQLNEKKQQLLAARRALLGHGPRTTGGTTNQLTIDDLVQYVADNPGQSPGQIAEHFGTKQANVSSHFYRNKTRFVQKDGRYWLRDPKSGVDTADDIEEDDEGEE